MKGTIPKNITEFRNQLLETFDDILQGKISGKEACERSKWARKIITTLNQEVKERKRTGSTKSIPFLKAS